MLKSDMADAKKGDSFMRHNITKKVISAMLSGVLMLSLAGCGKAAKLPETVVNTSLGGGEERKSSILSGEYV